ncbi:BTAD domain-containing putative transcriptional regulator [Actinomycetes bacterium KLBMP 9797]
MTRFRVLGPLEARGDDGRPVRLAGKPRTVLALLLLHANQPVSTAVLTDALWPLKPPRAAAGALRTHVWEVRRTLRLTGLTAAPPGYRLEVAASDLDLLLFDRLTEAGRRAAARGDLAAAADAWEEALALWRGPPFDGIALGAVAESTVADLAERRFAVLEEWAEARLALGQHAGTLPALTAAATEQPLRERLHELAMLALYRSGRQAEALGVFRRLRDGLVAELGVEPGTSVQRTHRRILAADPELGSAVDRRAAPRQLPPDAGEFTGRHRELAEACTRLVATSRLRTAPVVAIAGLGGVGKSSLAVRAAHRLAHRFPDGQLYVDLQGATAGLRPLAPLEVLGRFLRALGVRDSDAPTVAEASAAFRAAAAPRRLLVVLDNAYDAAQVRPLLPAGPEAATVVTSRRVLSTLDGASHVHLDVLPEREAVLLLGRIAGPARIAADPGAARLLVGWCGCLPLAVRIAGARLAARPQWPVRALADRLADARRRLDELRVAELGVRPSFQVGYELLRDAADPDERAAARAFPLLSLPDGPDLSLAAAAALLDQPEAVAERLLDRLADGQLLSCPAPGRYRQHDLLRLYGRELPADRSALTRLLAWYAATAWQAFRRLRPADPRPTTAGAWADGGAGFAGVPDALAWLEAERPNLLAAVRQVAADPALPAAAATTLARALFAFFHVRGYLNDWVEINETARTVARRAGDRLAEAHACRDLGAARELRGEYRDALSCLRDGLTAYTEAGDLPGQAACLNSIGLVHDSLGQLADAASYLERSLAISRGLADRHSQAISLNNLGEVYGRLGAHARAERCLREALEIFRDNGNRTFEAACLTTLGEVHERHGADASARACYERALALFQELDTPLGEPTLRTALGRIDRRAGHHERALAQLTASLAVAERLGERREVAACLRELGTTRHELGDVDAARDLWRRALAIFEELDVPEAAEVSTMIRASLT